GSSEIFDQMAGKDTVENHLVEFRHLAVEIDRLPAEIELAKFAGIAVGAVEVEIGAVGLQPPLPMRQPAIPGPDIEHIRAPRQRFEKAQPRMRLPEHYQQIVVGERQPPLSRAQPIDKTRQVLRY